MKCNHENLESIGHDSTNTNVLLALLAGVGAGLAVGILVAPKAGGKLRSEIGRAVDGYLDAASAAAASARSTVTGAVDSGAKEINNAIDQTVAAVRSGAKTGHDAVNNAASALRAGVSA